MMMESVKNKRFYLLLIVVSLAPFALIFNQNIWFDEAYTLSLIGHDYADLIDILKSDMHPPLYFLSLKSFCEVFGYSIPVTKIFSALGFSATVLCGGLLMKRHFGTREAGVFALSAAALPMTFYFSVQQRSYSWSVFYVTLCFLFALLVLKRGDLKYHILMAVAALLAAYQHFFALLPVAITFACVNLYVLVRQRKRFSRVLLADAICVAGYSFWLVILFQQAKDAVGSFWLKGVEPLSLVVFAGSLLVIGALLSVKANRRIETVFAAICALGLQVAGLGGTILVRPFYIGRYSIVIVGVAACFLAFAVAGCGGRLRKILIVILCVLSVGNLSFAAYFEYDPSISDFRGRFEEELSPDDTFVYFDTAFGIMSYYYPDNAHLCDYRESWFSAFDNVEYVEDSALADTVDSGHRIWIVKQAQSKIPAKIKEIFTLKKTDEFQCDFNRYEVYEAALKQPSG